MKYIPRGQECIYLIILTVFIIIVYIPTFTGGFILDDNILVKNNQYIRELHSLKSYLQQEDGITDKRDLGLYHTGYYRPLINFTYWFDYKMWGMNPSGFRTTNLLLHLATTYIMFLLLCQFLKNRATVFITVLFFAVHPVNTETVSVIVSRNNILATFFSLMSFFFYIRNQESKKIYYFILSVLMFLLGVFSKEFGVMLIPVMFLYNRFFRIRNRREFIRESAEYIPFLIILMIYIYFRHQVTGDFLTPFSNRAILTRIYFTPFIIIWNLRLLFLPWNLHQMNVKYPESLFAIEALISILVLLILLFYTGKMLKKGKKIPVFSLISFFIVLFPVLHIISSASTPNAVLALRWLYFPFSFLTIAVAFAVDNLFNALNKNKSAFIIVIIILYLGAYSYVMNRNLWYDEREFLAQEVLNFNNLLHAGGYAEKLLAEKNYTEAEKYFRIAIDSYPLLSHNYINYSALMIETGRYDEAIELLKRSEDHTMTHNEKGQWANNMGIALFKSGCLEKGLEYLHMSVEYAPEAVIFRLNYGGVFGTRKEYEKAALIFEEALDILPSSIEIRLALAKTYLNMGAVEKFHRLIDEIPENLKKDDMELQKLIRRGKEMKNDYSSDSR